MRWESLRTEKGCGKIKESVAMQEENTNNPEPEKVETVPNEAAGLPPTNDAGVGTLESVLRKIREAENVLVALSNSP